MTLLLDDPSPKVRLAFAEALALSPEAPPQIILALAKDRPDIASFVIARSPVLTENDLEQIVSTAPAATQVLIAKRPVVGSRLASRLAETGTADACLELLNNPNARLDAKIAHIIAKRHGDDSNVRGALLASKHLKLVTRYQLIRQVCTALSSSALSNMMGDTSRAEGACADALAKNLIHLTNHVDDGNFDAFIAEMQANGDLTTTFLIRSACFGKMDFVCRVFARLSGETADRVTSVFVQNRRAPLEALLHKSGISDVVRPIFIDAVNIWRDVAQGKLSMGPQEVTYLLAKKLESRHGNHRAAANDDIQGLLRSIYLETKRDNARQHAKALTAAAA